MDRRQNHAHREELNVKLSVSHHNYMELKRYELSRKCLAWEISISEMVNSILGLFDDLKKHKH
ncbi:MAG: hypothetical protein ACD_3C00145G0009 [uncultured bacterium (gcode 4)]|uniref:Uncharacterized protein n=1 Tax=uncultured bacterium (gcode 4) TaxID=1234023 RepID=K2FXW1_9BACT|nr:MAG: hypothetical protein ACD_3C00145G0009 [uncultured bacterium (gcode 4)]